MQIASILIMLVIGFVLLIQNKRLKDRLDRYESWGEDVLKQFRAIQKIINDDEKNKIERIKMMKSLTWKQFDFNETHKN